MQEKHQPTQTIKNICHNRRGRKGIVSTAVTPVAHPFGMFFLIVSECKGYNADAAGGRSSSVTMASYHGGIHTHLVVVFTSF
jgi:hypothetical protein